MRCKIFPADVDACYVCRLLCKLVIRMHCLPYNRCNRSYRSYWCYGTSQTSQYRKYDNNSDMDNNNKINNN